ncbi:MAG TPA: hypothetical protein VIM08_07255 [Arthrobacter sp.]|jgi:hypothetical protein
MDAIRNLVAGADPIGPNPTIPDGEEALHSMFSRPEVFADRVSPDIPTLAERRQRRSRIFGLMTIAAAAVTAGVLLSINLGPLTAGPAPANTSTAIPSPASSVSPTATTTPSPTLSVTSAPTSGATLPVTPAGPAAPKAEWERYSSPSAQLSFDLPPGWSVIERKLDGATPSVQLEVDNEQGIRIAGLEHSNPGGLGGACGPEPVPMLTMDSQAVDIPYNKSVAAGPPEFSFRVLDGTGLGLKVRGSLGLNQPDPHMLKSCMYYNTVNSPVATLSFATQVQVNLTDTKGLAFDSVDEAKAYMATEEYAQLKRMFTSLKLVP